jgi:16S rRNA (uracil1498-N3)-methyltransferase
MYKFFVNENQIAESNVLITGDDVNHIKNVLRLQIGEEIQICNIDKSKTYITQITAIESNKICTKIIKECEETRETKILLHIFQGLPKQEKMEQIIQKSTEIGVTDITPLKMERCVVKLDNKTEAKKIERWQKIAEVAAKQSKRDKIPTIHSCVSMKNIYEKIEKYDIVIVAYEEERNTSIKKVLKSINKEDVHSIAVIIGPEGGISQEEISLLKSIKNVKIVTLGKRILRTETAPLVLASVVMYEFDEME